jgi:hypothetical protein
VNATDASTAARLSLVSERTSRNIVRPLSTQADSSVRLWRKIALAPAARNGAASSAGKTSDSDRASVAGSG